MNRAERVDRTAIAGELERTRVHLHRLLDEVSDASLRRRSAGTRWTNEQLLFHMVFGYMVVQALLPLVRVVSRLPAGVGRRFAQVLDAGTRPFHVVNYYGSCAAALVYNRNRMGAKADRVIGALSRRLQRESESTLRRGMPFPVRWDPFFTDYMTIGELYLYPTRHFDFHEQQLTLDRHEPTE
ncbi:DinB family protein [Rhodococcus chondri]|uniref:DinB family protein n=1 Tax=Rhodococcus chondri TaxID=3065941 RepID=A0ABU7JTH0_9NOCA|nr:DinB family protein [Rhodococcus sp. CC-R104]MEE2033317.1 DinB family protein [Rhodococcus sp. CC-R104]